MMRPRAPRRRTSRRLGVLPSRMGMEWRSKGLGCQNVFVVVFFFFSALSVLFFAFVLGGLG